MGEGEFKKRIEKILKTEVPPNPPVLLEHPLYVVNVDNLKNALKELVKETKKDFPCYPKCQYVGTDTTKNLGCEGGECPPCEGCYLWKKWVKNWLFGDGATDPRSKNKQL